MLRRLAVLLWAFVFFAFCMWLSMQIKPAKARDPGGIYAGSPHEQWYKSQHNSRGEWCCNEPSAHPYFGDYTPNADGSITVEGETIPKEQVLTGSNPTGHAVWWKLGTRTYCFAPGTLS